MKILQLITITIIFSTSYFTMVAQENPLKASFDRDTVLRGETTILTLTLKNVEGEIKSPSFPSSIGIGSVSRSNSLSVMNGERSSLKTYRIPVVPTSVGVIEIPPAEVTTKDKVYYSEPLQLVVLPNPNYNADVRSEERARELERTSPYKVIPPTSEKKQPQKSKQLPSKRKVIKI